LVYAFEDFRGDPVKTLRQLCAFMGIDDRDPCIDRTAVTRENEHYSARGYALNKYRAAVTGVPSIRALVPVAVRRRLRNWLNGGRRFDIEPSAEAVRRITAYYRADNAALLEKRGICL
jgi:hypothetical protein